jgi:tetratricopeptide (TPR) repeat protein
VAEIPEGYRDVPEEDRKKAKAFFDHGTSLAGSGQFDYAISMFLDGLRLDPDAVDAHQKLRETSLKRKASGGKSLGMFDALKLKKSSKDDKDNLLNAEKLLAHDPGNADYMLTIAQSAARAGYYDTVMWIGPVLMQAEVDNPRPNLNRFLALKDVYKKIGVFDKAAIAGDYALKLKPLDMELQTEIKGLRAQHTIDDAGYGKGGSFRDSIKDMDAQRRLMDQDKGVTDADASARLIEEADKQFAADPNEPGKLSKLVDELVRSEQPQHEARAIKLLQEWFERTKQFRFRKRIGEIQIRQGQRKDRAMHKAWTQIVDPDERKEKGKELYEARRQQAEFELSEFKIWAENYPTDLGIKYEMGRRQFALKMFDEAIGSLQSARNDPSHRVEATVMLGKAFREAGYLDEADETLSTIIKDYPHREGDKYMAMLYWHGRVLEDRGKPEEAKKRYSQVFQLDSAYMNGDVAARLKKLRPPPAEGGGGQQ